MNQMIAPLLKRLEALSTLSESEAAALNPPFPKLVLDEDRNILWVESINDERWQPVGYIPVPSNRLGWFLYHLIHGLALQYPLHKIIIYSLFNTAPN